MVYTSRFDPTTSGDALALFIGLQTREHIVFECQMHEEYGDVVDEGTPDHQLATLFGTKTGIDALAEFVRKSKAFQKTRATEIP